VFALLKDVRCVQHRVLEIVEVVLEALEVREGVHCVLGTAKCWRFVRKVLEVVFYMLELVNGVRYVLVILLCILLCLLSCMLLPAEGGGERTPLVGGARRCAM